MAARSSPLIQASRSPAIRPTGQTQIDPSRHGDYPVVLGEKLTNSEISSSQFIGIRYNYKSKSTSSNQTTVIKRGASEKRYELDVNDYPEGREPILFKYRGSLDPTSSASDKTPTTLALVFDQDRQVFVVEPISTELNFNLVSGPGQVRQYPQLPTLDVSTGEDEAEQELWGEGASSASEDEPADSNNPFDYRHFLDQSVPSSNTPILDHKLGGSPSIQPQSSLGKHLATSKPSSQSPALSGTKKSTPKPMTSKTSSQSAVKASSTKVTAKASSSGSKSNLTAASRQPKSAAVITASDDDEDDSDDEITLAARSTTKSHIRAPRISNPPNQGFSSPQIVFDEASGLEIDMGSPPPESRNRTKIDPSAFASRSPSHSHSTNQSPAPHRRRPTDDNDRDMLDVQDTGDSDIEALALPPPKADTRQPSSNVPRRVSTDHQLVGGEDEDEDEDVEAFAAMMEQDLAQEEESEVSEEE